jgi:hypothetical protein
LPPTQCGGGEGKRSNERHLPCFLDRHEARPSQADGQLKTPSELLEFVLVLIRAMFPDGDTQHAANNPQLGKIWVFILLAMSSCTVDLSPEPSSDTSSDNEVVSSVHTLTPQEGERRRKRARVERILSEDEWKIMVSSSISYLKSCLPKKELTLTDFTVEQGQRYSIKNPGLKHLTIFPWFNSKHLRFRQTLKRDERQGPTIEQVLEAANFFLKKRGSDYSAEEIQFLEDYYMNMKIPIVSHCLTTIVEVYNDFRRRQEAPERKSGSPSSS